MMVMPLFIGTSELLLIAALVLLLFGGKKLPEMMRGMGQGVKAFKDGMNDIMEEKPAEQQGEAPVASHSEASSVASQKQEQSESKALFYRDKVISLHCGK